MRDLLFFLFCLLACPGAAQPRPTPPPDSLRPLSPARWLRYTYANDLFFRTDYYFTQGMSLTLVHPALARLPTQRLLAPGPRGSEQTHGVLLRYDGFTPLRIQDAFVRVGDRPYAAYLYAAFFRESRTPHGGTRLTTALELGFIGPAAGGRQLQTTLHRLTGNAEPRGWAHQIRNAGVLGYRVAYARRLLAAPGRFEAVGTGEASLGTLYTYAGAGVRLRAGRFTSDLAAWDERRPVASRWQLSGQATLEGRAIGYDATLQGGLFGADDPYVLGPDAVRRGVLRGSGGLGLARGGLHLAALATWVTPEFAGGRPHRWGQLELTVGL